MIFEKAIEMLQLKPEQLFVFEGTIEGIISAHGANLSVIGIKVRLFLFNNISNRFSRI